MDLPHLNIKYIYILISILSFNVAIIFFILARKLSKFSKEREYLEIKKIYANEENFKLGKIKESSLQFEQSGDFIPDTRIVWGMAINEDGRVEPRGKLSRSYMRSKLN